MIFEQIEVGPLGVNCIIMGCATTHEGILVDPGGDVDRINAVVNRLGLKIRYIVNTHGHFDHVGGNRRAVSTYSVPLLIHQNDAAMLGSIAEIARMYGMQGENSPPPDSYLVDGQIISFGRHSMQVLHTPGHTPGGCCFYLAAEQKIITGDTLFADSIGRTDLPGGVHADLIKSIRTKLFVLPETVVAYPGHGPSTTIGHEKKHNPFF